MRSLAVVLAFSLTPLLIAADPCVCSSAPLVEASYTWDFDSEASARIAQLQADAERVQTSTDALLTYARRPQALSQGAYFEQLHDALTRTASIAEVTCRLDIIKRMVTSGQRELVERMLPVVSAMATSANSVQDLIRADRLNRYGDEYREKLSELSDETDRLLETLALTAGALSTTASATRLAGDAVR